MNKKGFMMAELVVVSAVIIGIMTTFYVSYNKIIARYNKLIYYYDVGVVYRLGNYYETNKADFKSRNISNVKVKGPISQEINNVTYKDTLYYSSCSTMKNYQVSNNTLLSDYLEFFKGIENISDDKNCVIIESCQTKNGKERCKFSYMEVNREEQVEQ